jgi:hypothetical protein
MRTLSKELEFSFQCFSKETKRQLLLVSFTAKVDDTTYYPIAFDGDRFYFISNLSIFLKCHCCATCGQAYADKWLCTQHQQKSCRPKKQDFVKVHHRQGQYQSKKTIVETLESVGMILSKVDVDRLVVDMFACMDSESALMDIEQIDLERKTKCYEFLSVHKTIMICVCNNIDGAKRIFKMDANNPEIMFTEFVLHLMALQQKFQEKMLNRNQRLVRRLARQIEHMTKQQDTFWVKRLTKAQEALTKHCSRLIVLTYNGKKYDLGVFAAGMFFSVLNEMVGNLNAIKKGNDYLVLEADEKIRFVDWINFNPGFSLRKFLLSVFPNDSNLQKSFFPYSIVDSFDALKKPMPKYDDFFDVLHQCNALETEHNQYSTLRNDGFTKEEALKKLGLASPPPTGPELYHQLCMEWKRLGITSLGELMEHYIVQDTFPMLKAVERVVNEFRKDQIDPFSFLTISSVSQYAAFRYVARNSRHPIMLFADTADDNFRSLLQEHAYGGFSSVLTSRYEETGVTRIRPHEFGVNNAEIVQRCLTYDCVQMYTSCLMEPLPVSIYVQRKPENDFRPLLMGSFRGHEALLWLEYEAYVNDFFVKHKGNSMEKRITVEIQGKKKIINVDGFTYATKPPTVFEYVACGFASGYCPQHRLTRPPYTFFANKKNNHQLQCELEERFRAIRRANFKLKFIWSCQWEELKRTNPWAAHVSNFCMIGPKVDNRPMTEREIFDAVWEGEMHGFFLCSAVVPENLRNYFSDFPPLFHRATFNRDNVGPTMRAYCVEHDLLKADVTQLVSGFHVENVLYYSSYIAYLIELGVHFYDLKRVYQFHVEPIFRDYLDEISNQRLQAQLDGNEVVASNKKLLANSLYGATLRNETKDSTCKFLSTKQNSDAFTRIFSNPLLTNVTDLGDDLVECTMKKSPVTLRSPATLGVAVLNWSKFKLLSFYYSFLKICLDHRKHHLLYCDTDALKFALAGQTLRDCVPPEKISLFDQLSKKFIVDETDKTSIAATKRPGFWTLETCSSLYIGLAAKTVFETSDQKNLSTKLSLKGISHRTNFDRLTKQLFFDTLAGCSLAKFENTGFMKKGDQKNVVTYRAMRTGVTAAFFKRLVLPCLVHCDPHPNL